MKILKNPEFCLKMIVFQKKLIGVQKNWKYLSINLEKSHFPNSKGFDWKNLLTFRAQIE